MSHPEYATTTVYGREFLCRIFRDVASANAYMEANPEWAVLREYSGRVFLARVEDEGKSAA